MRGVAQPAISRRTGLNDADALVLLGIAVTLYRALRLALAAPAAVSRPEISLSPAALLRYTPFSAAIRAAAYPLSLAFFLGYGYAAARSRTAENIFLPVLGVLQSIPILSFLPVVLLGLVALLPKALAAGIASMALIVTSQARGDAGWSEGRAACCAGAKRTA